MRIFVTGATGFVGTGVVRQAVAAGHVVVGLVRSEAGEAAIKAAGAVGLRGDLNDIESLERGARAADAVIHCGFIHDFSNYGASIVTDKRAIETLGGALAGTGKPLLVTSGLAGLSFGRPTTEDDTPNLQAMGGSPRVSEQTAESFVGQGVRAMTIRLPPSVHGDGDHGFVPALIGIAQQKGVAAYLGDGGNRWPSVHRDDAARVFLLALEKGEAGRRYHAVDDAGVPFREIAAVIGRKLGLPVASIAPDQAGAHFGWMGLFAGMDVPASSALTRQQLGWAPVGSSLLTDLEHGSYFAAAQAA